MLAYRACYVEGCELMLCRNGEGAGLFNYLGGSEGSTAKDGLQFTFQWSSGKSVKGLKTTFTYLPPAYNG